MIFGISGSHDQYCFNRLGEVLCRLSSEHGLDTFFQFGPSGEVPEGVHGAPMLPRGEFLDRIKRADVIVTHGGPGAIFSVLSAGKVPVVFPREKARGEAMDNHQIEFCEFLARQGGVVLVRSVEEAIVAVLRHDESQLHLPGPRVSRRPDLARALDNWLISGDWTFDCPPLPC